MGNYDNAYLVGVCLDSRDMATKETSLQELGRMADTAGLQVVGSRIQKRSAIDKTYYAGKGFLHNVYDEMLELDAGVLIFDNELSPSQGRNIEREFELEVSDRTEVILNIFHNHAQTKEARLQVQLAELEYQLPRLKKLWSHLDREKGQASGSGGTSRGMGEKQIEIDKRQIRIEISKVKQELAKIQRQKETQRKMRDTVKKVCLVGYTNAGKSTLFNRLTDAGVLAQDKLFATLGTTTRKVEMERGHGIILSDTVGFIADLPHHLVASFRATLRDVQDADLLLHVVDSSDPDLPHYIEEVDKVLGQIEAQDIQQLMVFNKIDLCNKDTLAFITQARPTSMVISAKQGLHIDQLLEQIDKLLYQSLRHTLMIPHNHQKSAHALFELAEIETKEYTESGLIVTAIIHQNDLPKFKQFIV